MPLRLKKFPCQVVSLKLEQNSTVLEHVIPVYSFVHLRRPLKPLTLECQYEDSLCTYFTISRN